MKIPFFTSRRISAERARETARRRGEVRSQMEACRIYVQRSLDDRTAAFAVIDACIAEALKALAEGRPQVAREILLLLSKRMPR